MKSHDLVATLLSRIIACFSYYYQHRMYWDDCKMFKYVCVSLLCNSNQNFHKIFTKQYINKNCEAFGYWIIDVDIYGEQLKIPTRNHSQFQCISVRMRLTWPMPRVKHFQFIWFRFFFIRCEVPLFPCYCCCCCRCRCHCSCRCSYRSWASWTETKINRLTICKL